jgi:plastocyanin
MIWRSHICFRVSFSLLPVVLQAASVSGTVELRDSRVDAVTRKKDFSGVVISLQRVGEPAPAASARHAAMLQKNKTFTPHVLAIATGTTVDFPNADPIFHNAFSSYNGQIFDVGLYPPGSSRAVHFARPGVVRVFCNIHSTMSAIIFVTSAPHFVTTGRDGAFALSVPPGEYDLSVFHERATEQTLAALSRHLVVGDEPVRLPPIAVSEAGYLLAPHMNKYGKEYPPAQDDQIFYPGARN